MRMRDEVIAEQKLFQLLRGAAQRYPNGLDQVQISDVPRIAFHIGLVLDEVPSASASQIEIADIGGGVGLFSVGCALLGFKRVVLVDDFNDPINHEMGDGVLDLHRSLGVEVISRDVVKDGLTDIPGQFDAVTTFDSMEHWHHSPKALFHTVMEKLKPGGIFLLGVPNAVNLRKRITVPLGYGKWSQMQEWYERPVFRGHVREPDVDDLRYIARDLGLKSWRVMGRNWLGHSSPRKMVRMATKIADHAIRLFPQLCSDIYLIGKKPLSVSGTHE